MLGRSMVGYNMAARDWAPLEELPWSEDAIKLVQNQRPYINRGGGVRELDGQARVE